MKSLILRLVLVILLICSANYVGATTITGGSGILDLSYASQLETWLGEGPLAFTNIFTKQDGDGQTSYDFHNAVDGMGRTFTVIELLTPEGQIIGGFNPQSWSSNGYYNLVQDPNDRNAFIFNLTTSTIYSQKCDHYGQYQTYNNYMYGPTFGGGHDIYINSTLSSGYAYHYSYGPDGTNLSNIVGQQYQASALKIGTLEVYTIAPDQSPVPEPATCMLFGIGFLTLVCINWKRKNR
ncbi:PEP_CTERM-anchored TLD domain-containing protein [candidate division KSB1 bacterium]|nr:PEP_CTERM-anchored TLD domain-containing protein [candidate division KSB1 bacterium]